MGKFVVAYKGGDSDYNTEAQEASMKLWMEWFDSIGASVTDFGNPFGSSIALLSDGTVGEVDIALTGFTVLEAASLEHAGEIVAGCPIFKSGGSIEIYEAMSM